MEMYVKGVRNRLDFLNLSVEQAEKIVRFEEQPHVRLGYETFSYWEEMEWRLDEFRKILTDEQFRLYGQDQEEAMQVYEDGLRQADGEQAKTLAFEEAYIDWLKQDCVPGLRREALPAGIVFLLESEKVDEAVRAVAGFLLEKYAGYCPKAGEVLQRRSKGMEEKVGQLRKQYIGEIEIKGWHSTITPRSSVTFDQQALMSLLLMK